MFSYTSPEGISFEFEICQDVDSGKWWIIIDAGKSSDGPYDTRAEAADAALDATQWGELK